MTVRRNRVGDHCRAWLPQGGRSGQRGVTLVEMIFTILVLAVVTAIAVPSFRDASLGSRLGAIANSLHGSIQIARSEAIKANATTTLCASEDGSSCASSGDWSQGWIVLDAAGNVIHSEPAEPAQFKVVETSGTPLLELSFQPIGVGASAANFKICRSSPLGKQERLINVTATGIAYVTTPDTVPSACP